MNSKLINNGLMTSGIVRAYVIKRDDTRVFIPGMMNENLLQDMSNYDTIKEILPKALFNSLALKNITTSDPTPCWVVFENGDINRPIVMGFLGKGIKSVSGSTPSNGEGDNSQPNASVPDDTTSGAEVSGDKVAFLFDGNGLPQTASEMKKYLETITVNINDSNGNKTTMMLVVHKKLANDIQNIFDEIADTGFKILANETGAYNWRMNTSGTARSQHSYGTCIDINWNKNPYYSNPNNPCPISEYMINPTIVNIFAKYGWSWGGNWSSAKDYMHFTYLGN